MKRSQRGCRGCEAKACGASTWEVGYVVGSHYATAFASMADHDAEPDVQLCARHERMARMTTGKGFV